MGKAKKSVAERYIEDVKAGKILTSKLVRLQIERHERDLFDGEKRGLRFNRAAAQHVIDFFAEYLVHTQGKLDNLPFILEPFQQTQLWILYGWQRAETGFRRFKYAYSEIGRGNAKSELASGLCIYELVGFGEAGAEVYSAATDKDTARLVWDTAELMVLRNPHLRKAIKIYRDNMHIPGTASKFEPLAAEERTQMGKRPSFVCIDELHVHRTSGVWDAMISAMGKRDNPLLFAITNSGYDLHSVCWRQREYSEKVLAGIVPDDSWFAWICGLDAEDVERWYEEKNWIKANPGLGTMVRLQDMREQALKAREDPSALNSFLRFRLSVWTSSHTAWMPMEKWDACPSEIDWDGLRKRPCVGALDLSTTTDISAFVLTFPPTEDDPEWVVLPHFFLPADNIEKRVKRDRVPYDVWERQGLFELTEGNVIDYDFIRHRVRELSEKYDFQEIVFDRWNAQQIVTQLEGDGFTMIKFGQGFESMQAPTKRLLEMVMAGELNHGGNPVLRWMASNVMVKTDAAGNVKPDKEKCREKIDGIVAAIMGIGRASSEPGTAYTSTFVGVA